MFIVLSVPQLFSTQIVNQQRSSLVNPHIVTKLQFIRGKKTELFSSPDEERRYVLKMMRDLLTIYLKKLHIIMRLARGETK